MFGGGVVFNLFWWLWIADLCLLVVWLAVWLILGCLFLLCRWIRVWLLLGIWVFVGETDCCYVVFCLLSLFCFEVVLLYYCFLFAMCCFGLVFCGDVLWVVLCLIVLWHFDITFVCCLCLFVYGTAWVSCFDGFCLCIYVVVCFLLGVCLFNSVCWM